MNETVKSVVEEFYSLNESASETALMVTVPKTVRWEDYMKEISAVADGSQEMNFRVPTKPSKVNPGDKCFIVHDGFVRGWMAISSIDHKSFQCTTTGNEWSEGWYVGRSGEFHPTNREIPMKGFMGYKYVNPNDYL